MDFEWDENKREVNLAKHGVDFLRAQLLFDGRKVITASSPRGDEERHATTGRIDGRFVTVVWTWREKAIRLISARTSSNEEKRRYLAIHGETD